MNSYSADALVNVDVSVREGALVIQATARPDENSNNTQHVAGLSRLCSDIRRKVQRLQSSSAISEVRSDVWRLERLLWSVEVVARLAETGFDRRYGARPLQRALERAVIAPLSRFLVERPTLRDARLRLVLRDDAVLIEVL